MTVQAVWNGVVLARSDHTVIVEGNHYFPPEDARRDCFTPSASRSTCPWKGVACYLTVTAGGLSQPDAAWFYPRPSPAAKRIRNGIAFHPGVQVVEA